MARGTPLIALDLIDPADPEKEYPQHLDEVRQLRVHVGIP